MGTSAERYLTKNIPHYTEKARKLAGYIFEINQDPAKYHVNKIELMLAAMAIAAG